MTTLILSERHCSESSRLRKTALARGWSVERVGWVEPPVPPGDLVIYGEPLFAAVVAHQMNHVLLEPDEAILSTMGTAFTRREITWHEPPDLDLVEHEYPCFIKPTDLKAFKAAIFVSQENYVLSLPVDYCGDILVSEVVTWFKEFRVFVCGDRMTVSAYRKDGVLCMESTREELESAELFARYVVENHHLPPGFVIDVGLTDGGWAVVEFNPCWGSGLYECDDDIALDSIAASCAPRNTRYWKFARNPEILE